MCCCDQNNYNKCQQLGYIAQLTMNGCIFKSHMNAIEHNICDYYMNNATLHLYLFCDRLKHDITRKVTKPKDALLWQI
jgi:hypothetical protein